MTLEAAQIVLRPVISEKSMDQTQRGKYTFAVHDEANKFQIKHAVQETFGVTVRAVNTMNVKPKKKSRAASRRGGRIHGERPGWKKAIVTLADGDRIDIFDQV